MISVQRVRKASAVIDELKAAEEEALEQQKSTGNAVQDERLLQRR